MTIKDPGRLAAYRKEYAEKNAEFIKENKRRAWHGIPVVHKRENWGNCHENKKLKREFPEEWARQAKQKQKDSAKKWREKSRFKNALVSSYHNSRKEGFVMCSATAEQIEESFTGFCHNKNCGYQEATNSRKLCMDHCHETGKFRGWLCPDCNFAIGSLHDSKEKILGLIEYVDSCLRNCFFVTIGKEPEPPKRIPRTKQEIAARVKQRQDEMSRGIPLEKMGRMPFPDFRVPGRFKKAVSSVKHESKKNGILHCFSSPLDVCGGFTGKCQNHGCSVAEESLTRKLSLDHDHSTGKFRGWLCGSCNSALGMIRESKARLQGLLEYIGE